MWWWTVMVGGSPLVSYSVEVLGKRPAKKAAKAYGKEYIRNGGPGFPQVNLTREMPEGSTDMTWTERPDLVGEGEPEHDRPPAERFDLNDQQARQRFYRIVANFAGDASAPWCVSREWGFGSLDESEAVMYPRKRIDPKEAGRAIGTVGALIEAGYGGGTPETVRIIDDFRYPDGRDGVAIVLAPELPHGTVERFRRWIEERGLPKEPGGF